METMMTDERIADLLGRRHISDDAADGLFCRIRRIIAEAKSEQDAKICRLQGQIARDTAQIERMRAALVEARRIILADRTALVACFAAPGCEDDMAPEDERALAEYDEALRMIDEAMGETK